MRVHPPRAALWLAVAVAAACAPVIGLDDYVVDPTPGDGDGGGGFGPDAGALVVSPAKVFFSDADCDVTKKTTATVTNPRAVPVTVEASVGGDGTFTLEGAVGGKLRLDIPPGETRPLPLSASQATPGSRTADLVIAVAGEPSLNVPMRAIAHGALLRLVPDTVDFGQVRINTTPPNLELEIRNEGDVAVNVQRFAGSTSEFTFPSSIAVPAGGSAKATVSMRSGAASDPLAATVTLESDVPLCGAAPALTAKGQRVNQDVLVNPATVNLGTHACTATSATTAKVTITNYSTVDAVTFSTALPATSRFTVTPASSTVPKAPSPSTPATLELTIGLRDAGRTPGAVSEDLNVTITSPAAAAGTKTIKAGITVTGAVLTFSKPSISFSGAQDTSARVTNAGNLEACFDYVTTGDPRMVVEPDDELAAGGDDEIDVRWTNPASGNGQVTIRAKPCNNVATVICNTPLPVLAVEHL